MFIEEMQAVDATHEMMLAHADCIKFELDGFLTWWQVLAAYF